MARWIKLVLRLATVLLPLLLALLHVTGVQRLEWLNRLEAAAYDARLLAVMPRTLDERIVILDIDEKSLAELGHWPWPRHHLARLVERLFDEQQVAVLGMDIVFAEADDRSGLGQLKALAEGELRDEPRFVARLPELTRRLDHDQRFADALRGRDVVLGYYFTSDRNGLRTGRLPPPVVTEADLQAQGGAPFRATLWDGHGSNIAPLAEAAPRAGFFNPVVDSDGLVRALPLLARFEGAYYESLSLAVLRTVSGGAKVVPEVAPGTEGWAGGPVLAAVGLDLGGSRMQIAVDSRVAVLVPFRGPGGPQGGSFQYVSAADVVAGRLAPGSLRDKIVLLGTTAPGLQDLRATPVGEAYPGVETHANLISAWLDGHVLVQPDYAPGYELLVLLVAAALLLWGLPRLKAVSSAMLAAALIALLVGANLWLFARHGLVLPVVSPVLLVVLAYVLHTSYAYFIETRAKRELAHLFGSYVPPELVDEMVKAPERYSMRAEERELTVMFSDMRGFTQLSETMGAAELQALLNRVFSSLTHEIRQRRGTIDKYMGDCVMAFWGAPVPEPEHARLSVLAALAMRRAVAQINLDHRQRGWPEIGMGVGLNTGVMCVGDMGSDLRRSYTVIGDAVNLGSRLEGLGKHYGVDIVVSETTHAQAGDGFTWQELDTVKVKGKDAAVAIYTVLDAEDVVGNELERWAQCLQACRHQHWPQAQALLDELRATQPSKVLYALYAERVADWRQQKLPADWRWVTSFETK
ncbi:CHASE2 domain-containing protein [Hydrogenophaga atypica]|uniref:CHASE2 domain-containing protein n=1 Tax=Hydrogenophaga atypica TaxID=249409 RepID=A0ABW2QNG8_9BURK